MKSRITLAALLLSIFVIIDIVFFCIYSIKTDFSWPKITFQNYAQNYQSSVKATLNIETGADTKIFSDYLPAGSTAADLLQDINDKNSIGLKTKEFPGAGLFVEGLMGKNSDTKKNTYWFFYINGASSQVGVSQYKLKNADTVTFKYEEAKY